MDVIRDLLDQRRYQLDRQQAQLTSLQDYLVDHHSAEVEVAATAEQLSLTTSDPAIASQLQLDWSNLIRYCEPPKQQLVVRVRPDKA